MKSPNSKKKSPRQSRSPSRDQFSQNETPPEFSEPGYMSLRHIAFAVQEPSICAQFCVECLDMRRGPQTHDFVDSGMRWVEGRSPQHPFKLHFVPNATTENCYVDVLNKMRTLVNGNLDVWTQLMDNHICIGYKNAAKCVQRIVNNTISEKLKKWYRQNVPGNDGRVPHVGPVHRKDGIYQFYAMMPFGIIVELQQPAESYNSLKHLPRATTWSDLRPAFIRGELDDISTRDVKANVSDLGDKSKLFSFVLTEQT